MIYSFGILGGATGQNFYIEVDEVHTYEEVWKKAWDWILENQKFAIRGIYCSGYIEIHPDYYEDGINWNWQIMWYLPKEEWPEDKTYECEDFIEPGKIITYTLSRRDRMMGGTCMYGDNHEYPKRKDAIKAATEYAIEKLL